MTTSTLEPKSIPFNRPCLAGGEYENIAQAIANGHAAGDGPFTRMCQDFLESELDVQKVLLTTSCTHALEMAGLLLELKSGDEFITPSFTFVSTANAFALRGARPVFVDIRPDTLNIDESMIEPKITDRTKAIVVVHYAGVGCEMDEIMSIANRHGIPVIEDNAHGLFGKYRGRNLGTFGALATLSFHETKNFSCGEGGALIVNDPALIERAEVIRDKGTNRSRFFRGQVDKYTWTDLGSSYVISDLLAAYLYAQLSGKDLITLKRLNIWNKYQADLNKIASNSSFKIPNIPKNCVHPGHLFYILTRGLDERKALIDHLKARSVHTVFHYVPLHTSLMGERYGAKVGDCPVTESISEALLRLPFFNDLTESEQVRVIDGITSFYG